MAPQAGGWGGSRRLLRQLRDLMQSGGLWQDRLDSLVRLIADAMVAEVCSLYVMRAGEVLELFATQGLRREAVHRTRLRVGEGIVGEIASTGRPLSLQDAQQHPNFAYRPETGEEIFHSMLGVPLLRDRRVIGVLAVQNKTRRAYGDDELEALETVAMVLAEMVGGAGLIGEEEGRHTDSLATLPARLAGVTLNEGIGMGTAVPHERGIVIKQIVAEDIDVELHRLESSLSEMQESLDDLLQRQELSGDGEHVEVLETYRMFAEDRGWAERLREAVRSGLTAEAAVQRVLTDMRQRMTKVRDPYIRERYADLEDLGNRLLHHLTGNDSTARDDLPDDLVLVARSLGPAELLDYDISRLRAVALEEGSPTAHVAIVARALGIPMIGRCPELLARVRPGDFVIIDGDVGQALLRPRQSVRQSFSDAIELRANRRAEQLANRALPPETRDGVRISLQANAGLLVDLDQLEESGAEGVGLYRTEVPFMVQERFPDAATQTELYGRALDMAGERPVTFRTLDIGGDKALPYWSGTKDENPAMGWRAIRIGLDRPAMLRQQLRALLAAGAGRHLRLMFPMVSEVNELMQARALLDMELARHLARGAEPPTRLEVGVMLEVPALIWQLPALFARADFVSVGSNDLFQFLFAIDRGNPRLARRYDALSPPILTLLRFLSAEADSHGVPLSVCGEMAGHPLEALALIGCGIRILSMPPSHVASVRSTVRSLKLGPLQEYVTYLSGLPNRSVRQHLRAYAGDHGIAL
ncbi:phosphoenolpyruvate--protein phosphotransferase [Aquibaculum sediminis]|uniref:phosphoenolpyruvate--protein phosphotransferase n=1 Tax=Aquibaculum sediminis TaxID=3231907 RepID=UPI003454D32C